MRLRRGEGLNIIPFIDIILVLLAIVLSISTFIAQGHIKVDVPKSNSATPPKEEKKISISVDSNNQIFLDKTLVTLSSLKQSLKNTDSKTLIELRSDKNSKFEVFIQILDILKENQHENFVISTAKD